MSQEGESDAVYVNAGASVTIEDGEFSATKHYSSPITTKTYSIMNTEGGSVILRGGIFDGILFYSSSLSCREIGRASCRERV